EGLSSQADGRYRCLKDKRAAARTGGVARCGPCDKVPGHVEGLGGDVRGAPEDGQAGEEKEDKGKKEGDIKGREGQCALYISCGWREAHAKHGGEAQIMALQALYM